MVKSSAEAKTAVSASLDGAPRSQLTLPGPSGTRPHSKGILPAPILSRAPAAYPHTFRLSAHTLQKHPEWRKSCP